MNDKWKIVWKIKDILTTIKDMKIYGEFLAIISLDGYLRVYNRVSREKVYERYLNIHPEVMELGK
jgi:folate-dependent phosphoribosylglycinamide formyltransferase PurN